MVPADPVDALTAVVNHLACPVCGAELHLADRRLFCAEGHSFDRARQGYVSLLRGSAPPTADSAAMVAARTEFFAAGHYDPLVTRLAARVRASIGTAEFLVDAGAGTGHAIAGVLADQPSGYAVALDSSTAALRRAARIHPRVAAVGCDIWSGLPIRSGTADVVLNVFAPRNASEFRRVLKDDGRLIVVTPTAGHLGELIERLDLLAVDPDKDRRLDSALTAAFDVESRETVTVPLLLDRATVRTAVLMGPNAHHVAAEDLDARVRALAEESTVTAEFAITAYRPRG